MRKLNNTLYVTSPDRYLSLEGETVVVLEKSEKVGQYPLHNLEGIVTFGYTGASPGLMAACARRQIALTFLDPHGHYLATVNGETRGNVLLRREQYRRADTDAGCVPFARSFLTGKLFNARWVLERTLPRPPRARGCSPPDRGQRRAVEQPQGAGHRWHHRRAARH